MSGLQQINWNQVDTENIPSGITVNFGTSGNPINNIFVKSIISETLIGSGGTGNSLYNSTINDNTISVSVGGASPEPASNWKQKTLIEVLDTILFPTTLPTYTLSTISLSGNTSSYYEIGTNVDLSFVLTITKNDSGTIDFTSIKKNNNEIIGVTGTTSGYVITTGNTLPSEFGYNDPNNPNITYKLFTTNSFLVTSGTSAYVGYCGMNGGLPKYINNGVVDTRTGNTPTINIVQPKYSGYVSNTINVTGVYPTFATTSNITTLTKQTLTSMNSQYLTVNVVGEDDLGNKQTIQIPNSWSTIIGVEYYDTLVNNWIWINGSANNSLTMFNRTQTTLTINGLYVGYTTWVNNSISKIGARQLRFRTY